MKKTIKLIIDIVMTALLLMQMSYQVFGDVLHEWFGAGMVFLFLVHNILNIKWYGGLFKGKYSAVRVIWTVINIAALVGPGIMTYSGIVLSRHVFAWLPIDSGSSLARRLHPACSFRTLIAVSLHLGLHWSMVLGKFRKITGKKAPAPPARIMRAAALGIVVYGAICFHNPNAVSYMFLKVQFAFFDYDSERSPRKSGMRKARPMIENNADPEKPFASPGLSRVLSVLCGSLTPPAVFCIGRGIFSKRLQRF